MNTLDHKHGLCILGYKESPYLEECIQALKKQTSSDYTIYICTSTPNDFLSDIADKYSIPLLVNTVRNGIGSDWNFALTATPHRYVTLIHQDDIYCPEYVYQTKTVLEETRSCLVFTDYGEIVNGNNQTGGLLLGIKRCLLFLFYPKSLFREYATISTQTFKKLSLCLGNPIACPTVTFDRSLIPSFRFSETMKVSLDWEAWIQLAETIYPFTYIPQIGMFHRIHSESETTASIASNVRFEEDLALFTRLMPAWLARIMTKMYAYSYASNKR